MRILGRHPWARQRGFTLVELIMVIVILGAIGGMVAVFMKSPIDAYISMGRRASLTDVADTTVRRMARDIRRALPNSIRTSGTNCLEFIPTKAGGRYRREEKVTGDGTNLDFSVADANFNMLGSATTFAGAAVPAGQQIAVNDLIVIYNLGITGATAYNADNSATVTAVGSVSANETPIAITAKKFPLDSASSRFHVVDANEKLVSYVCSGSNLYRNASGATLTNTAQCPASGAVIATNVNCGSSSFNYSGSDFQRNALISMVLSLQDASTTESVTLQHEVNVSNTP